jgi:hypothetical protein
VRRKELFVLYITLYYSVDQRPCREVNVSSASQETPCILWNPNIHYHFQKFSRVCHGSLSWARLILSIPPHPTHRRSILILSSHLCLDLLSGLLPSGFPTKTLIILYITLYYIIYGVLTDWIRTFSLLSCALYLRVNDMWPLGCSTCRVATSGCSCCCVYKQQ